MNMLPGRSALLSVVSSIVAGVVTFTGCSRPIPQPMTPPQDLPPLVANAPENLRSVVLGPAGRHALIGEFKILPGALGLDMGVVMGNSTGVNSGVVWCVEPVGFVGDSLVLSVGMTWWPPGVEPSMPTRSITEGLMRCLGFVEGKAWSRGTVYLAPASVPRVEPANQRPPIQEGTQTLEAALEQAFMFGISAPFQVRGMSLGAQTQDGLYVDLDRGMMRRTEAHVRTDSTGWVASNRMRYETTPEASHMDFLGAYDARTVMDGVSYVVGRGMLGSLVPTELSRAALKMSAGLGRTLITLTAMTRAREAPGLSCVLRTLSPPVKQMDMGGMSTPGTGDDSAEAAALAASVDGGVVVERTYPGVDLEAAKRCQLDDEETAGPRRTF